MSPNNWWTRACMNDFSLAMRPGQPINICIVYYVPKTRLLVESKYIPSAYRTCISSGLNSFESKANLEVLGIV